MGWFLAFEGENLDGCGLLLMCFILDCYLDAGSDETKTSTAIDFT